MAGKRDKNAGRPIIIVRPEIVEGAHHGGAWKVAYADFVTAMMAFFLLMWLLNATTEDQRKGLADYFSPSNLMSHASSGSGLPFGGRTAFSDGALVSDAGSVEVTPGKRPPPDDSPEGDEHTDPLAPKTAAPGAATAGSDPSLTDPTPVGQIGRTDRTDQDAVREPTQAELEAKAAAMEKASFERVANDIRDAVRSDPELAAIAKQLAIDMTPEGLRVQIMDEDKLPMFASGSALPNDRARNLLRKIVPFLQKLPEAISIAGHTDATPYGGAGKTNWELSSERANATRRLLTDGGLADARIRAVTGNADRDPLLPGDPTAPANRRIAILVLRDAHPAAQPEPVH